MDAMEILQDIRSKIGKRDIFKHNRDELVASLIAAINDLSQKSTIYLRTDLVDGIIEQFRAILKFIYEYSSNDNPITDKIDDLVLEFENMIMEFNWNFTPVRNFLEQCSIGTRELLYDEERGTYYEEDFNRFVNYSRIRDRLKDGESSDVKTDTTSSMMNYWQRNPKAYIFKDRFYKALMKDYIDACWLDSEIKFDYEFVDFKYSELISFCASLLLIGEYFFLNQMEYPYGFMQEEVLIDGIRRLTDLSEDKVKLFLKYATYDFNYQKDKLTLIQSLIRGKEGYYFLASTLTLGLLPIKMCRSIFDNDHAKYEKDLSAIAKLKEEQMTNEIIDALKKFDYLDIKVGYQLKNKETNKVDAEYDILIYDNRTFNLYIAECKWFYIGDDEFEHNKLDKKIEKSISHRLEKDKFILNDPKDFVSKAFNKDKINVVKEYLISQNFMGMRKHEMPVIDFETLKYSIDVNDSFEETMDYINEDKYIDSIDFEGVLHDIEIEGYKFNIYMIVGKKN